MKTLLIISMLLMVPAVGYAEITEAQAVKCIMGEARGECYEGQIAVGEVLRRRGNIRGMYGCNASFKTDNKTVEKAKLAWKASASSNYSNGATHFEGDAFKAPRWAKDMKVVSHIGRQTFYAERN